MKNLARGLTILLGSSLVFALLHWAYRAHYFSVTLDTITVAELENNPLPVIDVRSSEDFAAGHLPGAINLPLSDAILRYSRSIRLLPPHIRGVVVYCESDTCGAAERAGSLMRLQGHFPVKVLQGGYNAWLARKRK